MIHRPAPADAALLLALAHLGGATLPLLQGVVAPTLSVRRVQELLAALAQAGLVTQHYRATYAPGATRRRHSVWELTPAGWRASKGHPLAPVQRASLAGRTLTEVATLSIVLLALLTQTPRLAGVYVALRPAVHPTQPAGRAAALVVIHQWAACEQLLPLGAMPWLPALALDAAYTRQALFVELDDGDAAEGLRRRAAAYAAPAIWAGAPFGLPAIPLWVTRDGKRQQEIARVVGRAWAWPWLSVAWRGLATNDWRAATGTQRAARGALADCLAPPAAGVPPGPGVEGSA